MWTRRKAVITSELDLSRSGKAAPEDSIAYEQEQRDEERVEIANIPLSNALPCEWTVMVIPSNAHIAGVTVVSALSLCSAALLTVLIV